MVLDSDIPFICFLILTFHCHNTWACSYGFRLLNNQKAFPLAHLDTDCHRE